MKPAKLFVITENDSTVATLRIGMQGKGKLLLRKLVDMNNIEATQLFFESINDIAEAMKLHVVVDIRS